MNELDHQDDELLEPELEDYEPPLQVARTFVALYLLVRNADRFGAWLRATAATLEQLIAEAEADRRDAAAPD